MTNATRSEGEKIAIYLGLGSNIGDREGNLRRAIERIKALGLEISKQSSVYETQPVGYSDQPWFLNQVIETSMFAALTSTQVPVLGDPQAIAAVKAEALLSELLRIEQTMGRERKIADGPRIIDIDLLLFGEKIIAHSKDNEGSRYIDRTEVFVPHPRMHLRRFVLEPMCEIAPDFVHPVLKKTGRELLASLEDNSRVRISKPRSRPHR